MDKEEILQKSRAENASAYLDERERGLRLREDSFALGIGLLLAVLVFGIKVYRGIPAADVLLLVTGMSAAGLIYRSVKEKRRSDILFSVLCTALAVLYLVKFLAGAA